MRALPLSAALLLWAVTLHGQNTSTHSAPKLSWGPAPAVFPAGAKMAVVSGDPGKAAPFTVQLSLPDGYRIPPHFHPTDETVEVKQGTFLVGMGDSLDLAKTDTMNVGAKGEVPANSHHYAVAKGATVVSVTAMGPFAMTYVNPADDPQRASQP
ncbi:MAG TPA: cupin domain-containing protein [Gemmatimonadales bacterium]|nr:cupin domain-containing protein [Gemmatimonadales bacterium]